MSWLLSRSKAILASLHISQYNSWVSLETMKTDIRRILIEQCPATNASFLQGTKVIAKSFINLSLFV